VSPARITHSFAQAPKSVLTLAWLATACTRTVAPAETATDVSSARRSPPALSDTASDGAGESIFELPSRWTDAAGRATTLAALRGGPRVLAMIYTNCTSMCPLTLTAMQRIEQATDSTVRFVLVTLDPERDTPAQLAQYARDHGLAASRWTLLTGSPDATRELSAVLSLRYRKYSATDFAHSNTFFILDAHGVIARRHEFGNADASIALLLKLSRAASLPSTSK
jgi:protein SCO1/2